MYDKKYLYRKSRLLIITLILFLCSCKEKSNQEVLTDPLSQVIVKGDLANQIDSLLQEETNIGFSGAVSVSINDKIIFQKGYGWTDSLKTISITPSIKFYLASTTKGVTGVMALIAQQNGLFSLSDSLSKIDPNCLGEYGNMSIKKMLMHTSGLSNKYETFGATQRKENLDLIYEIPLEKKGEFSYTGAGYWLTAALIEMAAKVPYEEYVHKNLFEVADMNSSSFWFEDDDDDKKRFAQKLKKFPPNDIDPNWGFRGSSGIAANIIDLNNYFQALKTGKLLSTQSLKQLFGPHKMLGSGIGVGYGWFTTRTSRGTTEIWSRGGEGFGHNSAIRWFNEENVVILILTNCGQIEGEDYEANKTVSDKVEKIIFD